MNNEDFAIIYFSKEKLFDYDLSRLSIHSFYGVKTVEFKVVSYLY